MPRTVSAIVPVYNGRHFLEKTLPPLLEEVGRHLLEVIVVDDSSTDGSAELAAQQGARVIRTGGRLGPAAARNLGAQHARGQILFMVDADVVVEAGAAERICAAFASDDVAAVFGSYDDRPSEPGFLSQYKNLLHHHTHQRAREEASTFWAGCGAVRRDRFLAAGGFDASRYRRPSIEDIELGYRLRAAGGKIRLLRELRGTHLKRWTLRDLLYTDIFRRAIPWTRLMLQYHHALPDLNISYGERARAAVAGLFFASTPLAMGGLVPAWMPLGLLVLAAGMNASLLALFHRRKGPVFALGGLVFHQFYYLYSTAAYLWIWLTDRRELSGKG